jgi:YD repeat-containing protein
LQQPDLILGIPKSVLALIVCLTIDALGRVTRYIDGYGREWEYGYGQHTNTEVSPLGLETEWRYNNRKDLVEIREVDLKTGTEREERIQYDKRHLAIEVIDGAGNVTEYEYWGDGLPVKQMQGAWEWEYRYETGGWT